MLNRDQIAAFVGRDPAAIRAIEDLFRAVEQTNPAQLAILEAAVEAADLSARTAQSAAASIVATDVLVGWFA